MPADTYAGRATAGAGRRRRTRTFLFVVGTRPNFMKIAPLLDALRRVAPRDRHLLVHTGQHYDQRMSGGFFEDLKMADPDHHLGGHRTPGRFQVGRMLRRLEPLLERESPDVVIVAGDGNSTLAGGLAAARARIPLAHVEAGLRAFDLAMPEEVNRILVDHASELLFIHSPEARDNLVAEGLGSRRIEFCGNTMIDALVQLSGRVDSQAVLARHDIDGGYLLVTLHRQALVDGALLGRTLTALDAVAAQVEVVFCVHPRTARAIAREGARYRRLQLRPPASASDFLALQQHATAVLTDSGGVQEETTFLGVPCFTLRDNTERPITISHGTNELLGLAPERIMEIPERLNGNHRRSPRPLAGWDGRAAARIAEVLEESF